MNLSEHKSRVLLFFCLAIVAGIAVATWRVLVIDNIFIFVVMWLALASAVFIWPKKWAVIFLLITGCLLGYWRYGLTQVVGANDLANYLDRDLEFVGTVAAEPEATAYGWKIILAAQHLADGASLKGRCLLYAPPDAVYNYGDQVRVAAYLEPFKNKPDFDASRYYRRFGIVGTCQAQKIEIIQHQSASWLAGQIINWRQRLSAVIKQNLPYPEADLAAAMTLGGTNKINATLKNAFSLSGLTHIIAISGLNVSLLVGLLFGIALALGVSRRGSLSLALVAVIFYVVLVGAPASAVRAGIMGALYLLAAFLGRLNKLINALAIAAAGSLLFNPLLLCADVGWQLSFLALLGIIYLYPLLRLWLKSRWSFLDLLWSGLALTLAAQAATWPVIAVNFQQLSLVAPLANLLAVWTTPFILIAVFGALILTWLCPLGLWWWPALALLKYLISVVELSASVFLASIVIANLNLWWLAFYYAVLIILVYYGQKLAKNQEKVLN